MSRPNDNRIPYGERPPPRYGNNSYPNDGRPPHPQAPRPNPPHPNQPQYNQQQHGTTPSSHPSSHSAHPAPPGGRPNYPPGSNINPRNINPNPMPRPGVPLTGPSVRGPPPPGQTQTRNIPPGNVYPSRPVAPSTGSNPPIRTDSHFPAKTTGQNQFQHPHQLRPQQSVSNPNVSGVAGVIRDLCILETANGQLTDENHTPIKTLFPWISSEDAISTTGQFSIALVCNNNIDYSMDAQELLTKNGYKYVKSFGASRNCQIPYKNPQTNVNTVLSYPFDTVSYNTIYNDLRRRDQMYFSTTGILTKLRNFSKTKEFPVLFPNDPTLSKFDIIITFSTTAYNYVVESLQTLAQSSPSHTPSPTHVFNLEFETEDQVWAPHYTLQLINYIHSTIPQTFVEGETTNTVLTASMISEGMLSCLPQPESLTEHVDLVVSQNMLFEIADKIENMLTTGQHYYIWY